MLDDRKMFPDDLVFDMPQFSPSLHSPLSHASIHPLPFLGMSPRCLYARAAAAARTREVPKKPKKPERPQKKSRLKQLLIPILRRIGYTGTMEPAADASPTAHS